MALPDSRYLLGRAEVRDDEAYSQALNFWGGQVDAGCASTAGNNAGFCLLGPSAIRYLSAPDGLNLPTMFNSTSSMPIYCGSEICSIMTAMQLTVWMMD